MKFAYVGDRIITPDEYEDGMDIKCKNGHKLICKRGTIVAHHFSHHSSVKCSVDNKGDWHIKFQNRAKKEYQEVRIPPHIADVYNPSIRTVIEFQHSYMDPKTIQKREEFYTRQFRLVWVFDVSNWIFTIKGNVLTKKNGTNFPFKASINHLVTVILDVGAKELLLVDKVKKNNIYFTPLTLKEFDEEYLVNISSEQNDYRHFSIPIKHI